MKREIFTKTELASVCEELALLLHAGVASADGLTLLAQQMPAGGCKETLEQMAERVDSGASLSAAVTESGCFPVYAAGLVQVGEQTGHLEEALQALARYYQERERTERRIRSALLYPSVLLVLMLVVIVVLLAKVLPIFNDVYASLGGQLSGVAGGLLVLGGFLNAAMPVLCVLLGAVVLGLAAFSVSGGFRGWVLGLWQKKSGDRGIARKMNDARFAQALAMGLSSGLAAEEALELAGGLLQNVPTAAQRCEQCAEAVRLGGDLAQALQEAQVLPASACRLLALGFRSGSGDAAMEEAARRLAQDADDALEDRVSGIEPTLVLVTSILVGAILLSVMLPLMNIMSAIG